MTEIENQLVSTATKPYVQPMQSYKVKTSIFLEEACYAQNDTGRML